jgi:hypothetical protein
VPCVGVEPFALTAVSGVELRVGSWEPGVFSLA